MKWHCLEHLGSLDAACSSCVYKLLASQLEMEWRLEKKNRDPAPEHVAYALTQSFSHASHRSGHNVLFSIPIDIATFLCAI